MEEYFRAKRELLGEGDTYGDMMAAQCLPGLLERLEELGAGGLDGCASPGTRLAGPDHGAGLQVEEWAANAAPDVGALQQLLSTLDDQRAVWPQIRVFHWGESRGQ